MGRVKNTSRGVLEMTDDKVVSDWPYTFADIGDGFAVFGPTVVPRSHKMSQWYCGSEKSCADKASALNSAHAAGRKSMEKDFQDLFNIANKWSEFPLDSSDEFDAWKKARGIE